MLWYFVTGQKRGVQLARNDGHFATCCLFPSLLLARFLACYRNVDQSEWNIFSKSNGPIYNISYLADGLPWQLQRTRLRGQRGKILGQSIPFIFCGVDKFSPVHNGLGQLDNSDNKVIGFCLKFFWQTSTLINSIPSFFSL